jgi:uncharacterized NAD(P)/FAD-binding protein YdhS
MEAWSANGTSRRTVAIIGGGASGVLAAIQLRRNNADTRVVIVESRSELGRGLAYSTPSLRHLLNVPAAKISAFPDQPDHFRDWLRQTCDAAADGDTFAPRAHFGHYLRSLLAQTPGIEHVRDQVVDYQTEGSGAFLTLGSGKTMMTDAVVLATGNFDPAPLPGVRTETGSTRYFGNAWSAQAYDGLADDDEVILIGTGLTAVDVVLRLRETGYKGVVTAVSRHAVLPVRHAQYEPLSVPAIPESTAPSCRAYLRQVRQAIRNGADWRAALDSLRPVSNELWLALSTSEQERFRRHLQRRWDVTRHRMAPSIADAIDAELDAGTLRLQQGRVQSIEEEDNTVVVVLQARRGVQRLLPARVINCTGPNLRYQNEPSPLIRNLFRRHLAVPGPLGTGLDTNSSGAVIAGSGIPSRTLFTLGPARQGILFESIAIPEIRDQAAQLGKLLTGTEMERELNPQPEFAAA